MNWIIDAKNEERIQAAVKQVEPQILREMAENPHIGILLVFYFSGARRDPESGSSVSGRFERLGLSRGYTEDEARSLWEQTPRMDPPDYQAQFLWLPPRVAPPVNLLYAPYPKVGLARFPDEREVRFQDIAFSVAFGFDTKKVEGPADLARFGPYPMVVLRMPDEIAYFFGQWRNKKLEISSRPDRRGTLVPVMILRGETPVVAVWPADQTTRTLFEALPPIDDKVGALRHETNLRLVKWVRPEWIVYTPFTTSP
jgi:hypothetical protein